MSIYPWQIKQWQQLKSIHQAGRLPHSLLLTGKSGLGIAEFAHQLAAAILCDAFDQSGVAETDNRDWHLFRTGNHPDYKRIAPEEEGKQIKIGQVRELIDFLQFTSQYGRKKLAIVDPADAMNHSAANGLLKTLEEPPDNALIILVSHHPERLPVTIRSRCQRLNFSLESNEEGLHWLQENVDDTSLAEQALRITGTPLAAKEFIELEQFSGRDMILDELRQLQCRELEPITVAERWNNNGVLSTVDVLQGLYHDMIQLKLFYEKANVSNRDLIQNLRPIIKPLDLFSLLDCCRLLIELKRLLASTVSYNTQGLMEEFILHWQSLTSVNHRK